MQRNHPSTKKQLNVTSAPWQIMFLLNSKQTLNSPVNEKLSPLELVDSPVHLGCLTYRWTKEPTMKKPFPLNETWFPPRPPLQWKRIPPSIKEIFPPQSKMIHSWIKKLTLAMFPKYSIHPSLEQLHLSRLPLYHPSTSSDDAATHNCWGSLQ